MLQTSFGKVVVKANGFPIQYQVEELPLICGDREAPLFIVEGRYKILPKLGDDVGLPVRLSCSIDIDLNTVDVDRSGLETGERLYLNSLYRGDEKLSIGAFDELDGLECYDSSLNGIEIILTDQSFLKYAYFCVAWRTLAGDNYENNGDVYTWFAADPSLA
jgi:hypothetical protein